MKIRKGFVTNSSSSSYGEVVIDNPVLLEILAKYKALGTFGEDIDFEIGDFYTEYIDGSEPEIDSDIETKTPAIHTNNQNLADISPPRTVNEVLGSLIELLDDYKWYSDNCDPELYQRLLEELNKRENEIEQAFVQIKWWSRQELYSGRFGVWEFKYDKENGEYYFVEETGCLDW